MGMKDARLHIVGLESLDDTAADPSNPDMVNKAWFYMFGYKVIACPKAYSHDWGACPYAHQNESARRRDPQLFNYSSCICPNTGKGECPHGTSCRYAHTLFEYWLHPARFRTQMCKAGGNCRRALCFFAHSAAELRTPNRGAGWAHSGSAAGGDGARLGACQAGLPLQPSLDDLQAAAAASASLAGPLSACSAAAAGCMMSGSLVSDSCGSNVSSSSCLHGASPAQLDAAMSFGVRDLDGGPAGLQLAAPAGIDGLSRSVAAATAGLRANSPGGLSAVQGVNSPSSMTALQQRANGDTGALLADSAAAAGVATCMWLQQAQQQQQQQLLAAASSMATTSVPFAAGLEMMSLQTAPQQHPMVAALMGSAPAAASAGMVLSAPLSPSAVLQGLTARVPQVSYAPMLLLEQQQQQQPASLAMAVQQMYQRGMMMQQPTGQGGLQYLPWL